MKKEVKVCYSQRANLGNALNPIIIEQILGRKVICTDEYDCETSGIGSGLRLFFKRPEKLRHDRSKFSPSQIWSAGFITTPDNEIEPIKNLNISSVRGELSKQIIGRIYEDCSEITTGDAGLLAGELVNVSSVKKYDIGIIPHIREQNELQFQLLQKNTPRSIIIDVSEDPLEILRKVAQCKCIVSSSLHGLIVADSLSIPNKWIRLTNRPLGDGFKFRDYYSIYNIAADALDVNNMVNLDIERIII